jgi:hypothetical protein
MPETKKIELHTLSDTELFEYKDKFEKQKNLYEIQLKQLTDNLSKIEIELSTPERIERIKQKKKEEEERIKKEEENKLKYFNDFKVLYEFIKVNNKKNNVFINVNNNSNDKARLLDKLIKGIKKYHDTTHIIFNTNRPNPNMFGMFKLIPEENFSFYKNNTLVEDLVELRRKLNLTNTDTLTLESLNDLYSKHHSNRTPITKVTTPQHSYATIVKNGLSQGFKKTFGRGRGGYKKNMNKSKTQKSKRKY